MGFVCARQNSNWVVWLVNVRNLDTFRHCFEIVLGTFNSDFKYQIPLISFDCWETNLLLYHYVFSQNVSSCCQFCIYTENEPTPLIGPGAIITIVILMKFVKHFLILPLVYCLHLTASFLIKKLMTRTKSQFPDLILYPIPLLEAQAYVYVNTPFYP